MNPPALRLGIVTEHFPPGPVNGVGAVNSDLAHGLVNRGCEVTVFRVTRRPNALSPWPQVFEEDSPEKSLRTVRITLSSPSWMRWRPGLIWERLSLRKTLGSLARKRRIQVLEVQDGMGLLAMGAPSGIPWSVRLHGPAFLYEKLTGIPQADPYVLRLERQQIRRASRVAAVSHFAADALANCGVHLPSDVLTVLPNAVDTEFFKPAPKPHTPNLIVFANSLDPRKGIDQLCRAMRSVHESVPSARLIVLGSLDGRPIDDEMLRGKIDEWLLPAGTDAARAIEFKGAIPRGERLLSWLQQAHVCCFPSRAETFGLAPLEAMACGKAVVYTETGAGKELIRHGSNGLLCDPESPSNIAEQLLRMLQNPQEAIALGEAARRTSVDRFSIQPWLDANLQLFGSMARPNQPNPPRTTASHS